MVKRRPVLTLGDIRALGASSLQVFCVECGSTRNLDVGKFPSSLPVSWFGQRLRCNEYGRRAEVRPLWTRQRQ
jgi:hypothetical protein